MVPVAKRSRDKASVGGRKWARRRLDGRGRAVAEVVGVGEQPAPGERERDLLVPLVRDGEVVGREPLEAARERHLRVREELPLRARSMARGEPALPTLTS
jgi:nicotinate phosphoribosyltransferase